MGVLPRERFSGGLVNVSEKDITFISRAEWVGAVGAPGLVCAPTVYGARLCMWRTHVFSWKHIPLTFIICKRIRKVLILKHNADVMLTFYVLNALAAQFITKNNEIVESKILTSCLLHDHIPCATGGLKWQNTSWMTQVWSQKRDNLQFKGTVYCVLFKNVVLTQWKAVE